MDSVVPQIKYNRPVTGMSAILLPFSEGGNIDWGGFDAHVVRTVNSNLVPAINMDTGYANLIDQETRRIALTRAKEIVGSGDFVAGAFVPDKKGDRFNLEAYQSAIDEIHQFSGTPIIFQSFGLTGQTDDQIVESYRKIAAECDRFYAFELGKMFAPFGSIYSLDVYKELLSIRACLGAKHSSLSRELEWQRLKIRDETRQDFKVLTGNDLAIDMIMYGSDYLLGLSTFAPELFSKRDEYWAKGDHRFFELNDKLQYLGCFAFRSPTPAYKHSAAMFLYGRGLIGSYQTHPNSPERPESDLPILVEIGQQLGLEMNG